MGGGRLDGWVDGTSWAQLSPRLVSSQVLPSCPKPLPPSPGPMAVGHSVRKAGGQDGLLGEKTSEQRLRRSQPDAIGKEVPIRVHSKCKGPGAGMCLRCSRTKRSFVHTHFPQKGVHTDPLTPPLTHLHTLTQAVPQICVLVCPGLHDEHGFIVLSSLGEMETAGKGWEVGIASP